MAFVAPVLLALALPLAGDCAPPEASVKESEPCGAPWVSGCGDLMQPTEPIELGIPLAGTFWSDRSRRDTDFFRFIVPAPTTVVARAWATETIQLVIVDACTIAAGDIGTCPVVEACLAAGTYEVFVAPLDTIAACGTQSSAYTVLAEFRPRTACVPLVGDLDGDGAVNGADITQLLIAWGADNPGSRDLNADGRVDGIDLGLLLDHWTG
jgi:hypothetical protein